MSGDDRAELLATIGGAVMLGALIVALMLLP
jgi:hypothetical protein